ncbi:MAG: CYTH domain-containing protein [Candidatus Pacebacteria bacterium]|nr:CYTH domain-containing protein [Candidatus Paceibacterota bacterium]
MNNSLQSEIEAKFLKINKDKIREKLATLGACLVRHEFNQKRVNFYLPGEKKTDNSWIRVRDDGGKITLSLKEVIGSDILDQKEVSIGIDSFDNAVKLLESIGCERKKIIFTRRELWRIDDVEITIDTWPFLEPFIEIEGPSEDSVKKIAELLGLNFIEAVFGAVGKVYKDRFGISLDEIEKIVGDISFDNKRMEDLLRE